MTTNLILLRPQKVASLKVLCQQAPSRLMIMISLTTTFILMSRPHQPLRLALLTVLVDLKAFALFYFYLKDSCKMSRKVNVGTIAVKHTWIWINIRKRAFT